ncbi:MAG: hypothetical protein JXA93_10170 [Anaerolineae bacterium]|nr:hypothetical protein [Anaerolineae bacterium]
MGEITWGTAAATVAALFVFLLPGWALLSLLLPIESFGPEWRPDAAAWLLLIPSTTLALPPLALLFFDLIGVRVTTIAVLGMLIASGVVVLCCRAPRWRAAWGEKSLGRLDPPLLALALVLVLVLVIRLWVVRGINVGFWGDSYQHTMIAQLLVDNGGLFRSWQPYAELQTLTYHFGFHADVALFQWATGWLTGNAVPRTVVLVGQLINVIAVAALYPLATRLSGSRWAGVVAVLAAGLLTPMPMYYVNWGRYTQLAGQAILPVAVWLTMEGVESPRWEARRLVAAAVATAGLGLTHYRVSVLYLTFLLVYVVFRGMRALRRRQISFMPVARLAAVGCVALLLVSPWLWRLQQGLLPDNLASYQRGELSEELHDEYNALDTNWQLSPTWVVWIAAAVGGWALIRGKEAGIAGLWMAVNLAVTNTYRIGVLDTGLVNNYTVIISLYMPTAILLGYLVSEVRGTRLSHNLAQAPSGPAARQRGAARLVVRDSSRENRAQARTKNRLSANLPDVVLLLLVVGAGILGAGGRAGTLDRTYQLVTPADEEAMAWIQAHTTSDACFLVNSFFAFGDHYIVGSDAGWWIPLLSGRGNTVPPLSYSMEAASQPNYRQQVNDLARRVEEGGATNPEVIHLLREAGVTHAYVGQVGGPLLNPAALRASPCYTLIYENEGALVFALDQAGPCD